MLNIKYLRREKQYNIIETLKKIYRFSHKAFHLMQMKNVIVGY